MGGTCHQWTPLMWAYNLFNFACEDQISDHARLELSYRTLHLFFLQTFSTRIIILLGFSIPKVKSTHTQTKKANATAIMKVAKRRKNHHENITNYCHY